MRRSATNWTLDQLHRRKSKIDPKPQYQRGDVWTLPKKQLLMDSVLRNYDMPKFYLRKIVGKKYYHEIVDGQQRMRSIWNFFDNKFKLGDESRDTPSGNLAGKYYRDLNVSDQDIFHFYQITVIEIEDAPETEIRRLFQRLQEGMVLTPAERRHAMMGGIRDFVTQLAKHRIFKLTNTKDKRFLWEDYAAHIVRIELEGGPVDVAAKNLLELYKKETTFSSSSSKAHRITNTLNTMAKVLRNKPPEMNIKWGFVDLYWAISVLKELFVLTGREDDIADFYVAFERRRRSFTKDPSTLISPGRNEWDRDLYEYIIAFKTEGAKRPKLTIRHQVYLKGILNHVGSLEPKDRKRVFNEDEKIVIHRRDSGTCKRCGKAVDIKDMHADHIKAHTHGGLTTIENGQTLCRPCNLAKGAGP